MLGLDSFQVLATTLWGLLFGATGWLLYELRGHLGSRAATRPVLPQLAAACRPVLPLLPLLSGFAVACVSIGGLLIVVAVLRG